MKTVYLVQAVDGKGKRVGWVRRVKTPDGTRYDIVHSDYATTWDLRSPAANSVNWMEKDSVIRKAIGAKGFLHIRKVSVLLIPDNLLDAVL